MSSSLAERDDIVYSAPLFGGIAQLVEQLTLNQ